MTQKPHTFAEQIAALDVQLADANALAAQQESMNSILRHRMHAETARAQAAEAMLAQISQRIEDMREKRVARLEEVTE